MSNVDLARTGRHYEQAHSFVLGNSLQPHLCVRLVSAEFARDQLLRPPALEVIVEVDDGKISSPLPYQGGVQVYDSRDLFRVILKMCYLLISTRV